MNELLLKEKKFELDNVRKDIDKLMKKNKVLFQSFLEHNFNSDLFSTTFFSSDYMHFTFKNVDFLQLRFGYQSGQIISVIFYNEKMYSPEEFLSLFNHLQYVTVIYDYSKKLEQVRDLFKEQMVNFTQIDLKKEEETELQSEYNLIQIQYFLNKYSNNFSSFLGDIPSFIETLPNCLKIIIENTQIDFQFYAINILRDEVVIQKLKGSIYDYNSKAESYCFIESKGETFYNQKNFLKTLQYAIIFNGNFLTDLDILSNFIRSNTECISIPIEDFKDFLFQFKIKKHLEGF